MRHVGAEAFGHGTHSAGGVPLHHAMRRVICIHFPCSYRQIPCGHFVVKHCSCCKALSFGYCIHVTMLQHIALCLTEKCCVVYLGMPVLRSFATQVGCRWPLEHTYVHTWDMMLTLPGLLEHWQVRNVTK